MLQINRIRGRSDTLGAIELAAMASIKKACCAVAMLSLVVTLSTPVHGADLFHVWTFAQPADSDESAVLPVAISCVDPCSRTNCGTQCYNEWTYHAEISTNRELRLNYEVTDISSASIPSGEVISAAMTCSDFVFMRSDSASTVDISLNLVVKGSADWTYNGFGNAVGWLGIRWPGGGNVPENQQGTWAAGEGPALGSSSGMFEGQNSPTIDGVFTTGIKTVDVGVPVPLTLVATLQDGIGGAVGNRIDLNFNDGDNAIHFPKTGPIFNFHNLPEGVVASVDSECAGISTNVPVESGSWGAVKVLYR